MCSNDLKETGLLLFALAICGEFVYYSIIGHLLHDTFRLVLGYDRQCYTSEMFVTSLLHY